jgi:hypothetical protein
VETTHENRPGSGAVPSTDAGPPPASHVVITVPGIRTFGAWQDRLQNLLETHEPGIVVYKYRYGYFSVIAFMIPFLRWLVTRRFRRDLQAQLRKHPPDARVDIVAHSFGTHLVGWGLLGIPPNQRPRINTIIFAGSVLKPRFRWKELLGHSVRRVINECGLHDSVLVLNQVVVLFTGMAGRLGFEGMMSDGSLMNQYHCVGHSGYFDQAGEFMRQHWVPVLTSDQQPVPTGPPDTKKGLLTFLLQNSEPIKVAIYTAPFIVLTLVFYGLWTRAEAESARARKAEQEALKAEQAALKAEQDRTLQYAHSSADAAKFAMGRGEVTSKGV